MIRTKEGPAERDPLRCRSCNQTSLILPVTHPDRPAKPRLAAPSEDERRTGPLTAPASWRLSPRSVALSQRRSPTYGARASFFSLTAVLRLRRRPPQQSWVG